jgi:AcrR family transcriptional regulator
MNRSSWAASSSRRMSADEVAFTMLSTAHRLIDQHGLTVSFDHLRMEDLIREAGVSKTSVYRKWPSKEDFLTDFLVSLVQASGPSHDQRNTEIVANIISRFPGYMETVEGRREILREAGRISVEANFAEMASRQYRNREVALLAALSGSAGSQISDAVLDHMRGVYGHTTSIEFYESMLIPFRRRFRSGCSAIHLARAAAATLDGLNQARLVDAKIVDERILRRGIDGSTVEWHIAAIAVVALVEEMTEDLPDDLDR